MAAMVKLIIASAVFAIAQAHMSPFHPCVHTVRLDSSVFTQNIRSVYGMGTPLQNPLGPGWKFNDWWYRGSQARSIAPSAIMDLPAGGTVTLEIACNQAWTSHGNAPTVPGSRYDACNGDPGPYHADYAHAKVDPALVQGCALGIADKDNIEDVTMDDITIFSVNHSCVSQKMTDFQIPAKMPACSCGKCICAWFWLAMTGTGNYYMTGFDCSITNVAMDARKIATPEPPVWCNPNHPEASRQCKSGAKQPIYFYNEPTNVPPPPNFNGNRPGYNAKWSYEIDGAQDDIFTDELAVLWPEDLPPPIPEAQRPIQRPALPSHEASTRETQRGTFVVQH